MRQLTNQDVVLAFSHVLAKYGGDPNFSCLRFIDPYGDTTFNYLQAEVLSSELSIVAERVETPEARAAVEAVQALVEEVKKGVHLYVKFLGD